jgi:predicted amidohydrolase
MGGGPDDTKAAGSALDGPALAPYRALARAHGLWLFCGGFAERVEGDGEGRVHNAHVVVRPDGSTAATYRKVHLFDAENLRESAATAPGSALVVVPDAPCGPVGLSVCYDVRFPALYESLAFERGARVLAVPAAFTVPTGQAHWETLLRARAIETQCAVVAAAQAGRHNEARVSYGHSLIVDAWGRVLARADADTVGIIVADLDDAAVEAVRDRMPIAAHRAAGRARLGWGVREGGGVDGGR